MKLTPDQVRHIAKLARISLTPAEVEKFTRQMCDICGYMEKLDQLDTEKVPETNQVTGINNSARADIIEPFPKMKELIETTKNTIEDGQIKVKKSI